MDLIEQGEHQKLDRESRPLLDDFLEAQYSFGWQCWLNANICLLDETTICFGAGTFIVIMETISGTQKILPTVCHTGVACIIAHPNHSVFAVAEKGSSATIDIYTYPDLKLSKLLKGGSDCSYVCIDFSPDGNLLAALAQKPDCGLTLWQWETERIILRSKAFSVDVWKVAFSKFAYGKLTTGGRGHIKFWSMAKTFTGLKLKGQVGKFDHNETSDIHSFVQLPDGKVISSSQQGNMLLWDENKLQTQIIGGGGAPCHKGIIHHICMEEGELYTIGSDGWIKVWDCESIEMINPDEEEGGHALKPLSELKIRNADLRFIVRSPKPAEKRLWYAQDANGIVWKVNVSLDFLAKEPEAIIMFPGIKVTGCEISPSTHILAISSRDAGLRLYHCIRNTLIAARRFDSPVTSMLWGTRLLDRNGASLILGFENGVIRWIIIRKSGTYSQKNELLVHKVLKPHDSEVTCIKINSFVTHMASCGLDGKVFFYFIRAGDMVPIGFVDTNQPLEWMLWLLKIDVILVGNKGCFAFALETTKGCIGKKNADTYELPDIKCITVVLRNMLTHSTLRKRSNPDEVDTISHTEVSPADSDESSTQAQEGTYSGVTDKKISDADEVKRSDEMSCNVSYALYTGFDGKFWICSKTNAPAFIYEYEITKGMMTGEPITLNVIRHLKLHPITQPQRVTCMAFTPQNYYLLTGQNDGIVTAYELDRHKTALQLTELWSHRIMDCENGAITFLSCSFDGKFLAAASDDNNALLFKINAPKYSSPSLVDEEVWIPSSDYQAVPRDIDATTSSLEKACKAAVEIQKQNNLEKKRQRLIHRVAHCRSKVSQLIDLNLELPIHMQINLEKYAVHEKIRETLDRQVESAVKSMKVRLEQEIEFNKILLETLETKFYRRLTHELLTLKSFLSQETIKSCRMLEFPIQHYGTVDFTELEELNVSEDVSQKLQMESHSIGISLYGSQHPFDSLGQISEDKLKELLEKHMGDYKLKSSLEYCPPQHIPAQPKLKRLQILHVALQIYEKRTKMNEEFLHIKRSKNLILPYLTEKGCIDTDSEEPVLKSDVIEELLRLQTAMDSHKCNVFDSVCPWHVVTTLYKAEECPKEVTETALPSTSLSWKIFTKFVGLVRRDTSLFRKATIKKIPWERSVDLSRKLNSIKNTKETYEKGDMHCQILKELWSFDCQVHLYKLNKCLVDAEIKQAELRRFSFIQEYNILKKYEEQKDTLQSVYSSIEEEKVQLEAKLKEQLAIINQHDELISSLIREQSNINDSFKKILGDSNKYERLLTRIFKKKIRFKPIEGERDLSSDTPENFEEYEEVGDSEWSTDDEEFGTEWDFKECPLGCDSRLFDSVNDLRQKRTLAENKIKEIKQLKQIYVKESEIIGNRCKSIENSLFPLQKQLKSIQTQKQVELNKIDQIVHLHLSQIIHCKLPIPQNLQDCLVFPCRMIDFFKEKLSILTKGAGETTKVSMDVEMTQQELKRECRRLAKRAQELKQVANERMMEKFGRIVDLEELKLVENPIGMDALKNRQKEQFINHRKMMKQRLEKVAKAENVYTERRKERAVCVQMLTSLKAEWLALHNSLSRRKMFTYQVKTK